jgi:hypothetical protein
MAPKANPKIKTSDTAAEVVNPEYDKLIEVLKFTPRTYKISAWGYGGEYAMGTFDRKIYDYFKSRRLDFTEFCYNDSYAEEENIPEEMWPFTPGCWHECDNLIHTNGAGMDCGTLEIFDENDVSIYRNELNEITDDDIEINGGDEAYVHHNVTKDKAVFCGISNEKGLFFEGHIYLTAPFDKEKLTIIIDDVDGNEIMRGAQYDGEDIDCMDMSTNGKGYDMYMYALKKDAPDVADIWQRVLQDIEHYHNLDSIDYPMTDWFPKKTTPAREGTYEIRTAGKNGYCHRAIWTGTMWKTQWSDDEVKIKEWRGIAVDPDAELLPE